MIEIWKPIPGYDDFMASSLGRIKSIERKVNYNNRICHLKDRILKPHKGKTGYYTVAPFQKTTYVHHLVALAFIGERPPGLHIDHIDGNYINNHSCNLRYVTQKENVHNALRLNKIPLGENTSWAKLNNEKVLAIRSDKRPYKKIAKHYGVALETIRAVILRRSWKHI